MQLTTILNAYEQALVAADATYWNEDLYIADRAKWRETLLRQRRQTRAFERRLRCEIARIDARRAEELRPEAELEERRAPLPLLVVRPEDAWQYACERCGGEGQIAVPTFPGSPTTAMRKCRACNGRGYTGNITIAEEQPA